MAEANRAVHILNAYDTTKSGGYARVSLAPRDDEDFVTIRINYDYIANISRWLVRQFRSIRNDLHNAIFPNSFLSYGLAISIPAAIMMVKSVGNIFKKTNLRLWNLASYLPGSIKPHNKAMVVSVSTGTCLFFGWLYVRRAFIKTLLLYKGWLYETPFKQSYFTKLWSVCFLLCLGRHPQMYSLQKSMPHLPVPKLQDTVEKYLISVKHIFSPEKYEKAVKDAKLFLENDGIRCQRLLVIKSWFVDNYVTDWWEKYVYLKCTNPIMINSNYYVVDLAFQIPSTNQCARTACVIYQMCRFNEMIDSEDLPPMLIRESIPLCMNQYARMFATTRIPGKECDQIIHYPSEESRHIVVLANGIYFKLDVYDRRGRLLKPYELEISLNYILSESARMQADEGEALLPALTAGPRDVWAQCREEYMTRGINKQSLAIIESAKFFVTMNDYSPNNLTELGRYCIGGSGCNIWIDKSINLVSFADGHVGLNCEHSWADAPTIGHMWEFVNMDRNSFEMFNSSGKSILPLNLESISAPPRPVVLQWNLNKEGLLSKIHESYKIARGLIDDFDLFVLTFREFGKDTIKKMKLSPDGVLQQVFQLAYYNNQKTFSLTYESSMTRLFLSGRTETVRSCTAESKEWVLAMVDPENKDKEMKKKLLRKAVSMHQKLYRDSMSGKGFDRHLFALYVASQGLGIDSEFLKGALGDPWKLSTSQQPQRQMPANIKDKEDNRLLCPGGGFGPVANDGYGISYMLAGSEILFFHISCKKSCPSTSSEEFSKCIFNALLEVQELYF